MENKRKEQREKVENERAFHAIKMKKAHEELERKKSNLPSKQVNQPQTPSKLDGFGADFGTDFAKDFGKESSSDED